MSRTYRQGDVLLLQVETLPTNAAKEKIELDRIVLAYGEATGHAHALSVEHAQSYRTDKDRYLVTTDGATLVHEEHGPIALKPGVYRIVQQREYVQRTDSGAFVPMAMGVVPPPFRPIPD